MLQSSLPAVYTVPGQGPASFRTNLNHEDLFPDHTLAGRSGFGVIPNPNSRESRLRGHLGNLARPLNSQVGSLLSQV